MKIYIYNISCLFLIIVLAGLIYSPNLNRNEENLNKIEDCFDDRAASFYAELANIDRYSDHKEIASLIDDIRHSGIRSSKIAEVLSTMLPHNAEIYQNKDKWEVLRLRSYILLVLGEIGFPETATPSLIDALVYIDDRMKVVEVGSAIRVLGNLGPEASILEKHIISSYHTSFSDEQFSLERYEVEYPLHKPTTIQLEIIDAIGKICTSSDRYAIDFLESVISSSNIDGVDRRAITKAKLSLKQVSNRTPNRAWKDFLPFTKKENKYQRFLSGENDNTTKSTLISESDRKSIVIKNVNLTDHENNGRELEELLDRPILLTFFYTRCQNERKCSATIAQLASLQSQIDKVGLTDKVRLMAATYEPHYDTPKRLKRYATDRNLKLDNNALAIKFDIEDHQRILIDLGISVGYNGNWVNSHAVEAILLDRHGRVASKYNSIGRNLSRITADFIRLQNEDKAV